MTIIETEGLSKRYAALRGDGTLAVDRLSVQVEAGQVYGFLGPNGSGKTTTIGMLLGIINPTGGAFRLFGGETPAELHAARQRIGATLEYPNFYPYLSCRDNLRVVARVKGSDEADIAEVLDIVGLASRRKTKFKACSLGMKQRLALAATMIGDPELIILDEPANGLDPAGQREIRDIIRELASRGKTIFLSSHMLHEVERTCTHVAIIETGRLVREGSVDDLTSARTVAAVSADGDMETLRQAVSEFEGAGHTRVEDGRVLVQIGGAGLSELNRFLAGRGIYASHLSLERQSLEDAFMEITGTPEGFGEIQ
ncbi:MAG: ABC transporter ATP-binding protein [Gemmatimonadetes bacterium]|nr:ABC transporter ATP-binding protein [Gemmatimonadota bacterium]MCZ0935117.1 ABC transporter ATP-binding protein [Candidatus Palauibacter rhopaloidicola]